jgi:paraquat-inducible protein A
MTCRWCGHAHAAVPLTPGERAHCLRCDTVLAQRAHLGLASGPAYTLGGLILAVPALLLPFITTGKWGASRTGSLLSSVEGLWDHGLRLSAVWVGLCGVFVPVALLLVLAFLFLPACFGTKRSSSPTLSQAAHALAPWAMPEVQVLAILVAFIQLGKLVQVSVGPGFWCYGAMSLLLLLAWRGFELAPEETAPVPTL